MPAPSYETLKQQKAELEEKLEEAETEVEELRTNLGHVADENEHLRSDFEFMSSKALTADRLQLQLRRALNLLANLKDSYDLGYTANQTIREFVVETTSLFAGTEGNVTP